MRQKTIRIFVPLVTLVSCVVAQDYFQCTKEGFHEDPNNCARFYRCVDWGDGRSMTPMKFECGAGTVFSKTRGNICTYPADSGRPECGDSENSIDYNLNQNQNQNLGQNQISGSGMPECTTEGWLEDPDDCQRFYQCVNLGDGTLRRYAYTCGAGTVWDQDMGYCNHPSAVNRPLCRQQGPSAQGSNQPSGSGSASWYPGQSSGSLDNSFQGNSGGSIHSESQSGQVPESSSASIYNQMSQSSDQGYFAQSSYNFDQNEVPVGSGPSGSLQPPSSSQEQGSSYVPSGAQNQLGPSGEYLPSDSAPSGEYLPGRPQDVPNSQPSLSAPNSSGRPSGPSGPVGPYGPSSPSSLAPSDSNTHQTQGPNNAGTQAPSSFKCTTEGFFPNPNNCHKFIRCAGNETDGYRKFDFDCGPGTAWDQDLQTCTFADQVEACRNQNTQSGQSLSQSGQTPYQPEQTATQTSQPAGQTTSQLGQNTVQPSSPVGPSGSSGPVGPIGPSGPSGPSSPVGPSGPSNPSSIAPTVPNSPSSLAPSDSNTHQTQGPNNAGTQAPSSFKCTTEGFFPNPNNCHKFIRCAGNETDGYRKFDFDCGPGTAWDQDLQTCNFADQVEACNNQNTQSGQSPLPSGQSTSQPEQSATQTSQPAGQTPPQLVQTTVQPVSGPVNPSDSSNPSSLAPTVPNTSQMQGPSNAGTQVPPSAKCTAEGFFPNPYNCHKFIRCVGNNTVGYRKFDFDCGPGTAWDQALQTCNFADQVEACNNQNTQSGQSPSPSSQSTSQPEQSATQTSQQAEQTSSQITTNVYEQQSVTSSTPETGSMISQVATTPNANQCGTRKPSVDYSYTCDEEGFKPVPVDCRKFYRCVSNGNGFNIYHFECGEGTIFDPSINVCNHPESVYPPRDCSGSQSSPSLPVETATTKKPAAVTSTTTVKPEAIVTTEAEVATTQAVLTTQAEIMTEATGTTTEAGAITTEAGSTTEMAGTTTEAGAITTEVGSTTEMAGTTTETETSTMVAGSTTEMAGTTTETETSTMVAGSTTEMAGTTTEAGAITTEAGSTTEMAGTTTEIETSTMEAGATNTETVATSEAGITTEAGATTTESGATTEIGATTVEAGVTTTEGGASTTGDESTTEIGMTTDAGATTTEGESTTNEAVSTTVTEAVSTEASVATAEVTTTEMAATTEGAAQTTVSATTQSTETSSALIPPGSFPCPVPNLSGDQFVLICPSGFRRYPKYCNLFYQCTTEATQVKILVFSCPKDTIFDEKKLQCIPEEESDTPCEGFESKPSRVYRAAPNLPSTSIAVTNAPLCPAVGHFPYESGCSNTFYKCNRDDNGSLQGYLYKCPEGFVYWSVSRRCERVNRVSSCSKGTKNVTETYRNKVLNNLPTEFFNISARKNRWV